MSEGFSLEIVAHVFSKDAKVQEIFKQSDRSGYCESSISYSVDESETTVDLTFVDCLSKNNAIKVRIVLCREDNEVKRVEQFGDFREVE